MRKNCEAYSLHSTKIMISGIRYKLMYQFILCYFVLFVQKSHVASSNSGLSEIQ